MPNLDRPTNKRNRPAKTAKKPTKAILSKPKKVKKTSKMKMKGY